MKRIRGKRVFLLAASAFPLLAEDDVPAIVEGQDILPCAAQSVFDNDSLHRLPRLRTLEWLDSSEVVIPFRPTLWNRTVLEKRQQKNHSQEKQEREDRPDPPNDDARARTEVPDDGNHTATQTANATEPDDTEATDLTNKLENETESSQSAEKPSAENSDPGMLVDYASKSAGALVLEKSSNFQGTSNLLNGDRDKYAIVPCEEEVKYVVIGLSEEILVKQVEVANYERYSSHVKDFNVLGSTVMGNWVDLGTYESKIGNGKQTFVLKEPSWARYLKFRILSHYGDEHYLTVSQISVFGSTILQGFHEQWNEEESGQAEVMIQEDLPSSDLVVEDVVDAASTNKSTSQCFTALNAICLNEIDFERSVFLFNSVNHSDFEAISALSAASICLSSTQSLNAFSHGSFQELNRDAIVPPSRNNGDDASIIAKAYEAHESAGILSDSQVVKTIQNLIKKTAGIQLDVESKSDGLMQKSARDDSSSKEKDTTPVITKAGTADSGVSVSLSDEASVRSDASHRNEKPMAEEPAAELGNLSEDPKHVVAFDLLNPAFANFLQRLPSAECLERMNFAEFKTRALSTRGTASSGTTSSPQSATEPIFKKLTDEIKALQSIVSAHDQFTKEFVTCCQRVLLDLMIEFEALQVEQDVRFQTKLEEFAAGASGRAERISFLIGFVSIVFSFLLCFVSLAYSKRREVRRIISRSVSDSELSKLSAKHV